MVTCICTVLWSAAAMQQVTPAWCLRPKFIDQGQRQTIVLAPAAVASGYMQWTLIAGVVKHNCKV